MSTTRIHVDFSAFDYSDAERRVFAALQDDIKQKILGSFGIPPNLFEQTFGTSPHSDTHSWGKSIWDERPFGPLPDDICDRCGTKGRHECPYGISVFDAVAKDVELDKRIVLVSGGKHG